MGARKSSVKGLIVMTYNISSSIVAGGITVLLVLTLLVVSLWWAGRRDLSVAIGPVASNFTTCGS